LGSGTDPEPGSVEDRSQELQEFRMRRLFGL
jgi:hypothetical protein